MMPSDKEIIIERMVDLYVGIDDFKTANKHFEEDTADIEFGIDEILGFMQEARKDQDQKTHQEEREDMINILKQLELEYTDNPSKRREKGFLNWLIPFFMQENMKLKTKKEGKS